MAINKLFLRFIVSFKDFIGSTGEEGLAHKSV
jgi:hypothetical protein